MFKLATGVISYMYRLVKYYRGLNIIFCYNNYYLITYYVNVARKNKLTLET